jgi:hypothetical protein
LFDVNVNVLVAELYDHPSPDESAYAATGIINIDVSISEMAITMAIR